MNKKLGWTFLSSFIGFVIFGVAGYLLFHHVRQYRFESVWAEIKTTSPRALGAAVVLVVLQLLAMIQCDWIGLRALSVSFPWHRVAFTAFVANALSRTIGLSMLASGAVHYRFYHRWGLTAGQVAKLLSFLYGGLVFGFLTIAGLSLMAWPMALPEWAGGKVVSLRGLGAAFIFVVLAYLAFSARHKRTFGLLRWRIPIPSFRLAAAQVGVSSIKWALDAAIFYALISSRHSLSLVSLYSAFFTGQLVAALSHAPGGLGVLDATLLFLLKDEIPAPSLAGSLLMYRTLYNLMPLIPALLLYGGAEIRMRKALLPSLRL